MVETPRIPSVVVNDITWTGAVSDLNIISYTQNTLVLDWTEGNFNNDGSVTEADAAVLAANWGATLAGSSESEPVDKPTAARQRLAHRDKILARESLDLDRLLLDRRG